MTDDEILRSDNIDPTQIPFSFDYEVNGKTLQEYLDGAAEDDAEEAAAQSALDEAADANPTPTNITNYISNERIIAYVPFDGSLDAQILNSPATKITQRGDAAYQLGYYHKALNLAAGHMLISGFRPKSGSTGYVTGSFTMAAWVKLGDITSDPVLFGNKDWDSGNNKGFLLCFNSNSKLKFNIGVGNGHRDDHEFAYTNTNDWIHIIFTVDRDNNKVGVSVNFGALEWYTVDSQFGDAAWNGSGNIRYGNDFTDKYDRVPGLMDDALAFKGVATSEDIANLQAYYAQ